MLAQMVKCLQCGRPGFESWVGKIPWRRECLPTPVFLPGEFHGEELSRLQSIGSKNIRHNLVNITFHFHLRLFSPILKGFSLHPVYSLLCCVKIFTFN